MIECFALWFICKPPFDKLVMTTTLPSNQVALSVFLTPLAKGTENLGATCYRLITQQERTPLWSSFDCFLHLILISVFTQPSLRRAYTASNWVSNPVHPLYATINKGVSRWDDYNTLYPNGKDFNCYFSNIPYTRPDMQTPRNTYHWQACFWVRCRQA